MFKNYHSLVSNYFAKDDVPDGEIGIEIEVEGRGLPLELASYWDVHVDGSLRGESAEYVLSRPIKRKNVIPYLEYLKNKLRDSVVHDSIRTSVHVHINMAEKTILQVYIILIVYFILENLIIELAGKSRIGNLFCLRIKDAEYLLEVLRLSAEKDNYESFSLEQTLRYAAANICALPKFNSLEFRAMRGTVDPTIISEWIDILLSIVDNAVLYYKTPLEVIQDFSAVGAEQFSIKILGKHIDKFTGKNIHRVLWDGARTVQELAYCTDWTYTDYQPVKKIFGKKLPSALPAPPRMRAWATPPRDEPAFRVTPRTSTLNQAIDTARNSFINQSTNHVIVDNTTPLPTQNWTTGFSDAVESLSRASQERRILDQIHQRNLERVQSRTRGTD